MAFTDKRLAHRGARWMPNESAAVVAATPPLQERELIEPAAIAEALTAALLRRGCDRQTARLATDVGIAVLRVTTERWMADERADFAQVLATSAGDLRAVAADVAVRPSTRARSGGPGG